MADDRRTFLQKLLGIGCAAGGVFRNYAQGGGIINQNSPSSRSVPYTYGKNKLGSGASFVKNKCPNSAGLSPNPLPGQPAITNPTKLNPVNPVTVPANPATKLMLANPNRQRWSVTNVSTDIIYIALGYPPTSTSYDHVLPGCVTSANDGSGGVLVDETFLGDVWAIALAGGSVAITEVP